MNEPELRIEMCRVGRSLYERGYAHGTAGNISVSLPHGQGFLITPTDACLGTLRAEDLSRVDVAGRLVAGAPASKTLALHRRIYGADTTARCVLHTHATHLVALSLAGVWQTDAVLPPITPYFVMKVGRVPLIAYHRPGDPAQADAVAQTIAAQGPLRAVLLERLGPVVWQATPAAALAVLEELEETARLWWMTLPRPAPLDAAAIEELRRQFGVHW